MNVPAGIGANTSAPLLVLDIHGIGRKPDWIDADEDFYWCDCAKTFERILDAIPRASVALGGNVALTFDDGNASDFSIAAPALLKRGLPASFFVCAGRIGKSGYLDRGAMLEMITMGFHIGSHGWSHIDWRKADNLTLTQEVNGAKRKIEDIIGQDVNSVAIPFGSYDRRVIGELRAYSTIYTSDGDLASPNWRIVPRVSYDKRWDENTLLNIASRRAGAFQKVRRFLARTAKRLR